VFILVLQLFIQNKFHRFPNLIFPFVSCSEIITFDTYWLQTDWPRRVCLDEPYSLVDNLRKDCSFSAVSKSLHEHAPLTVSSLSDLEKRMNTCLIELKKHAETILSLQCGPASLEEQLIAPEQSNSQFIFLK